MLAAMAQIQPVHSTPSPHLPHTSRYRPRRTKRKTSPRRVSWKSHGCVAALWKACDNLRQLRLPGFECARTQHALNKAQTIEHAIAATTRLFVGNRKAHNSP